MERPGIQAKMEEKPETIKKTYKGSNKLDGKIALITGGDSGIGRAIAVHYAREGATVFINYLNEEIDAEKTKELVQAEGQKCYLMAGDLMNNQFCEDLIESVINKCGRIDILVNNAAMQFPKKSISKLSLDNIKDTFNLNIVSMIYLTKLALNHLEKGARIINTSSVLGYKGHEMLVDYSATKGAIASFTRALSAQLASKGILVNGVAPGPILTPAIPATMGDVENFGEETPLERCGQPSEVAPAYVFLASADATYITGQMIHVNGGVIVNG